MSNEEVQATEVDASDEAASTLEVNTDTSINAPLDEVTDPDTLKKVIHKLRSENAKKRTEQNATKEELAEFKAWKESQMSEAEKLQARAEAAEAKAAAAEKKALIKEFNIDEDLADLITGTEEEMRTKAERLAARIGSPKDGLVPNLFATPGGEPVRAKPEDDGAAFLLGLDNS